MENTGVQNYTTALALPAKAYNTATFTYVSICLFLHFIFPTSGWSGFHPSCSLNFFFTHHFSFYYIDAYFKVHVICLWTHICTALAGFSSLSPERWAHLPGPPRCSCLHQPGCLGITDSGNSLLPFRQVAEILQAGQGEAARATIGGEPVRMRVLSVSSVESLRKSCVNRGRITKNEPLQLWAFGAIWGWIC